MTKLVNLEDCCKILDSQRIPITANNRIEGPYPYYGANGIQDYVAGYIFDDELVLLAEDGGNFGSKDRPIAYRVSGKCWVNNHAHVLKPKSGLDVDYLCYSLAFYDTSNLVNGATRKKLTQSAMRKMKIPLPPLNIQIKIVDTIKKVRSIISFRQSQLDKLDTLVKARFVEMFGDPCCNQLNWKCKKLNEITSKIGSGATPKGGKESYVVNGVSFVRSLNVYDGNFVYKNLAHLTQVQASQLQNVTLEKNDVLINITGASVARSCIVPNDILPARVNQHVSILRPNLENVNPVFLNQLLISYNFKNKLLNLGSAGGATRQAITKQQLEDLEIILPPIELQNQFTSFVQQVDKSKVA
ncbi:restriction endonuclease subunit S [Lactobacillus delbrueckii]|uniref:restriction endonuclease subunit S n=1 Tax=Lactobacillus delbrueckii TaxID=1584 RepID=UPI0021A7D662|nr:restriction endonuclease subunit S [Lactobacillus delbrueckii]MCT2877703.1 restriction endonuclease subunit S [Lactobacillus delbrueckii]MCT3491939.1 restriction endonuclease subunit S [Lactobacillus delbrueckii]